MEAKLYVGNLSYQTTEDELRDLFAQAGTVVTVDLIKDRVYRLVERLCLCYDGRPK